MEVYTETINAYSKYEYFICLLKFTRIFGQFPLELNLNNTVFNIWILYTIILMLLLVASSVYGIWLRFILRNFNFTSDLVQIGQELFIITSEWLRFILSILNISKIHLILRNFENLSHFDVKNSKIFLFVQLSIMFVLIIIHVTLSSLITVYNIWFSIVLHIEDFLKLCSTLQIYNFVFVLKQKVLFVNKQLKVMNSKAIGCK